MDAHQTSALPLARQPDSVRWLPASSPVDPLRPLVCATWDWDTCTARIEGMVLSTAPGPGTRGVNPLSSLADLDDSSNLDPGNSGPTLQPAQEWGLPSRCSSQVTVAPLGAESRQCLLVAGTEGGDVVAGVADSWVFASSADKAQLRAAPGKVAACLRSLHSGSVAAVDYQQYSGECLSAGEDGRLLAFRLDSGEKPALQGLGVSDGASAAGRVAYSGAAWLSPSQAVSALLGGGLQWWDTRQSTRQPSALSPLAWRTPAPGAITAFHVHPSRQHLLVAGGSCGTLLLWDLRAISAPVVLCGSACLPCASPGTGGQRSSGASPGAFLSSGDVLDVCFDPLLNLGEMQMQSRPDAPRLPPVLACTGDGTVSAVANGQVTDLFVGTSAACSFDVEPDFGQHVVCSMDNACLAYQFRARLF